jgi:hypothetical protein
VQESVSALYINVYVVDKNVNVFFRKRRRYTKPVLGLLPGTPTGEKVTSVEAHEETKFIRVGYGNWFNWLCPMANNNKGLCFRALHRADEDSGGPCYMKKKHM